MSIPAKPQGRRWSARHLPRGPAAVVLAIILAITLPAAVSAETVISTQATADGDVPLIYMPRPTQRAGLCLVDTGVDLNPDTEGVLADRTAIDGGGSQDVSPTTHGTVMAMMAAAPANEWGMVGTAPTAITVVSVRILEPGQTTFPFSSYAAGIVTCLQLRQQYDIRVINLSLGTSETPGAEAYEDVGNAIKEAADYGVAVVAAAGNDDGGPVEYPAAYPGVLAVGASNAATGQWCSFSNRGAGVALIAPGCALDGADPLTGEPDENYWQGTSEASVISSAALTALFAYAPGLSVQAAEEDLTGAHSGVLDIAQSFRAAGLAQLVAEGEAAEPKPSTPTTPSASSNDTSPPQELPPSRAVKPLQAFPEPHARLRRTRSHDRLLLTGRPSEAQAQVRYLGRRGHSRQMRILRILTGSFQQLQLPAGVIEIQARNVDPFDLQRDSAWLTLHIPEDHAQPKASGR